MQSMFRPDLLKGKRILVTGGGTGLGKVMSSAYLEHGAEVYICGRRGEVLEESAEELMSAHGGVINTRVVDIKNAELIEDMMESIFAEGPLDGLVNNAAGQFVSPTKFISPRGFDAITDIVFKGTFYVTSAAGRRWIEAGHKASVISILTTWIWTGGPFTVPSSMSKAGVHIMTKSLAAEWGRYGIRLNAIAPGPFPTEGAWARLNPGTSTEEKDLSGIPLGRYGEMDELANLALFLMGDGCEYLTGQSMAIDGAQHLGGPGTFDRFSSLGDDEWAQMREMIQASNAQDKAKRTVG